MKILLFNSLYYPNNTGGAEISTQILAEELYKKGHEPVIITISDKECIDIINNVKIYYLRPGNIYFFKDSKKHNRLSRLVWHIIDIYNPWLRSKINKIIESEKPDISHTNNLLGLSASVWNILKKNKIPISHTIRDYYLLCRKSSMFHRGKICSKQCYSCKLMTILKKHLSKYVDSVIGISDFILKEHIGRGYFRYAKKNVIYNPIKPNYSELRSTINKPLRFAYIGTISNSKGAFFVLNSFLKSSEKISLVVVGKPQNISDEEKIRLKYRRSNINIQGYRDPEKIFHDIDVLIIPSLWNEPLSRVILEAYSHGIPVIASSRGGIKEIVDDGRTGFLFNPDKDGDLEKAIERFSNNPSLVPSMADSCLKKSEEFCQKKISEKYLEIYNELVELKNDRKMITSNGKK